MTEALSKAKKELSEATKYFKSVHFDVSYWHALPSAQPSASGGEPSISHELRQEIESQEHREKVAYDKYIKAKDLVFCTELALKIALELQKITCTVARPHKCCLLKATSDITTPNLSHRFWKFVNPSPPTEGPYKFQILDTRVIAFRDIQEKTGSKMGNGQSGLRTCIDADGFTMTYSLVVAYQKTKNKPIDSWGLMRQRYRECYLEKEKERAEERERLTVFRKWCIDMNKVHSELYDKFLRFDTMRPFDLGILLTMYRKGYAFLNKTSSRTSTLGVLVSDNIDPGLP